MLHKIHRVQFTKIRQNVDSTMNSRELTILNNRMNLTAATVDDDEEEEYKVGLSVAP